jgi:toxin CcdB
MPRYDVYPAPEAAGYLLDVQADLLYGLNTRVVVPLLPEDSAPRPARILNPVFEIGGTGHVMATQFLSAVPASILRNAVGSLRDRSDAVTRALDMVFHGF